MRNSTKDLRSPVTRRQSECKMRGNYYAHCFMMFVLLFASRGASAQADIHFSQFYETSILRNPALTGIFGDDYKLGAYYRNQWNSISNPYSTFLVTAESHLSVRETSEDFISFGLVSYYDKAGSIDQKITTIYPAFNYNKSLDIDHNRFLSV